LYLLFTDLDNKLRFFWRMGNAPSQTKFPQLYVDPVIPDGFPDWKEVMDNWGMLILATAKIVAEMCALGFGLPADTFTSLMEHGPHLLAPTGSDFARFGKLGTVLASFHTDINFLTIHGRARFPGLFVWTREGKRLAVNIPHGCLLLQAGQQFERLTGGQVLAGFHEVVVSEQTVAEIEEASQTSRSLWRVSSTLFSHIASDQILQPLGPFVTSETLKKYPPITAGAHLLAELAAVNVSDTLSTDGETVIAAM
jgi:isopenicillin N synthase-like dioxygenase